MTSVRIVKDDGLLPPKLVRQDQVYKKCNTIGEQLRYLSLGLKQLVISKDKELLKIVNVIPIEQGAILLDYDLESQCVCIKNSFRSFELKFCDEAVINDWLCDYKEVAAGKHEYQAKYANELLSYLIKGENEELKMKRIKAIESELGKLNMTVNRLEKEKYFVSNYRALLLRYMNRTAQKHSRIIDPPSSELQAKCEFNAEENSVIAKREYRKCY
eukprot:TRINITY_DN1796_c0_g2_i7.p1 TRINITY_DN1796_c0_g2~~TRINITY_DN1796_c0_g2_i7.p1  ORF type:complete len:215 (+),score=30.18 TRINITY_DN1796_c0_g2_i7:894-1538(+)